VTSQAPASRPVAGAARFTKPRVRGGAPSFSWVFGGNSEQVDVYDETTKAFVSTCSTCQGISLAISPKSGDLAVGNSPNEVTVWHVSASGISQFAALSTSAGAPEALAYDGTGNLYVGDAHTNAIDVFSAKVIAHGGGAPARTIHTTLLASVYFLATTGHTLVASGQGQGQNNLVVSVDRETGADKILQMVLGYASGLAFDADQNLNVNTGRNVQTFTKPWKGLKTGQGRLGGDFYGLSLDATGTQIWSTHEFTVYESLEYTALQSIGYPIGNSGGETVGDQGVGCDSCQLYYPYRSVALYPQPAT
jgi:hypothetical protein